MLNFNELFAFVKRSQGKRLDVDLTFGDPAKQILVMFARVVVPTSWTVILYG